MGAITTQVEIVSRTVCVLWEGSSGRKRWHMYRLEIISLPYIQNEPHLILVCEAAVGLMPIGAGRACHQNLPRKSVLWSTSLDQNLGTLGALPLKISVGVRLSQEKNFLP
jgi:hypothetical protein